MDFLELVKERYSCRSFSDKKVEKALLDKILEAGRLAPTAVNFQPQRIFVLQEEEQLRKLSECTAYGWNAPVIMIVCYDKDVSWKRKFDNQDEGIVDTSIVTTHMMLEIVNLGLGTTWIGAFDPEKVKTAYNIPANYEVVALLPVGYPSENAKPSEQHEKRNFALSKYSFLAVNHVSYAAVRADILADLRFCQEACGIFEAERHIVGFALHDVLAHGDHAVNETHIAVAGAVGEVNPVILSLHQGL